MKTLYLDIFSGISGDMFIGAMIDLGVPFDAIERELEKLDLDDWHAHASRKHKSSIEGVKFDVHCHEHGHEDHDHDEHEHESHHHDEADHDHGHGEHTDAHAHGHHEHHHDHGHSHAEEHAHEHSHTHGRNFSEIRGLIQSSSLSPWVKEKAVNVFERIARAEGKIHGQPLEQVHFHEVGAVDS
ncbi:MAG: nickel insertion protein, partial [Verrucomicrobiota bacterium]